MLQLNNLIILKYQYFHIICRNKNRQFTKDISRARKLSRDRSQVPRVPTNSTGQVGLTPWKNHSSNRLVVLSIWEVWCSIRQRVAAVLIACTHKGPEALWITSRPEPQWTPYLKIRRWWLRCLGATCRRLWMQRREEADRRLGLTIMWWYSSRRAGSQILDSRPIKCLRKSLTGWEKTSK